MPEFIALKDAAAVVKKPRAGAADFAFKRPVFKAPEENSSTRSNKRPRLEEAEESGSFRPFW